MVEFTTFEDFSKEALRIIAEAEKRGLPLRLMGGAAIRIHCPKFNYLYGRLGRVPRHDMDFATYSKYRPRTKALFTDLGYRSYVSLAMAGPTGRNRQIFNDSSGEKAIDVFFDKLQMCHVIDFRGRLELDSPTIPLAELLLQKLQIVEVNEKDLQDAMVLLREHDVGSADGDVVNGARIAGLLSDDWGFHFTVTTNLKKIKEFLGSYESLTQEDRMKIATEVDKLLEMIEREPKSLGWKMRSKIGTNKKWYTVVEEVER